MERQRSNPKTRKRGGKEESLLAKPDKHRPIRQREKRQGFFLLRFIVFGLRKEERKK